MAIGKLLFTNSYLIFNYVRLGVSALSNGMDENKGVNGSDSDLIHAISEPNSNDKSGVGLSFGLGLRV